MIYSLLDFTMNGHTLQNGIVLFQFHSVGRILPVFNGNIPGCSGLSAFFMFGTLQNNLDAIAFTFFSHFYYPPSYILALK